ncbi:MAG: O-antigen ligase family protein [Verrucomicrobia bacterium]|nr:O-antigen ligase family protein [Verrucomicrobiota bacterium]
MPSEEPGAADRSSAIFAGAVGLFIAIALLKFGNPVVLEHKLQPPEGFWEWLIWSWPATMGYWLLGGLAVLGIWLVRWPRNQGPDRDDRNSNHHALRKWIVWLPLAWFVWQCVSAMMTVNWPLTLATLKHFAAGIVCFYLGFLLLSRAQNLAPMWMMVLAGFIGVVAVGFEQHFGGLEATRQFIYAQPDWESRPPEFLKKIASNRIYATLFYPNTLAGAILLFLPMLGAFALVMPGRSWVRGTLAGAVGLGGVGCLYWSGSKTGWLIFIAVGLAMGWHLSMNRKLKWALSGLVLCLSLTGFFLKYAGYFEKGATSVSARLDYWRAAAQIASARPVFGSGPGTFSVLYRQLKSPEAEMARLVHNDYLEQASDSGWLGGLLFAAMMSGTLIATYRAPRAADDWMRFGVWAGLVGLGLQSFVEFGFYIPALAWPAFLFLGWLLGNCRNRIDNPPAAA